MLETILVVPDTHAPFHDARAWALMMQVGRAIKPHYVVHLGDLVDFYALSSHDKDPVRALMLEEELTVGKELLRELKSLKAKKNILVGSNHHDRLVRYLRTKAPELHNVINERQLLELDKIGFETVPYRQSYKIGRMRFTHDVNGASGKNAVVQSMERMGHNVCIGHIHRIGYFVSGNLAGERHVGLSVGWLGDLGAIDYMHRDTVTKDWSLGFGVGYHDTENDYTVVNPIPIMPDYSVVVNAVRYVQPAPKKVRGAA